MNINSGTREMSNDSKTRDKIEVDLPEFYVLGTGASISQKPQVSHNVKSNALYKICFSIGKAGAIPCRSFLSFHNLDQKPVISDNVADYEAYFTEDLLDKGSLTLSEKLGLFKPQLPMTFLVNRNQEWRINEIFKSMVDESTNTYFGKNEMIRTFILELMLFTRRLIPVD
jgi:hypothetical protein